MQKILLIILPALLFAVAGHGQPASYAAASIPEAVKKDADVVKLYENIYFEITDIDRAVYKEHTVYTIMNAEGRWALHFRRSNDKFDVLVSADIKVYDESGKVISKYKKKDLTVTSYSDGLIDDDVQSSMNIPVASYPVTVEYIVEEKRKGSLHLPNYMPCGRQRTSVLQSNYTAKVPRTLDLRYKVKNFSITPKVTEDDKYKTYEWAVKDMPAFEYEDGTLSALAIYPVVLLAATRFRMDDYEGDMSTWKGLGEWYNTLHKGLEVLPEDRKEFFRNLVKDAKDDREKVRLIYDYLQKNFRYVSIQLGIGGWKSLPASFTDQKKYGDCKGLSMYMYAALKAVGIRSHNALINSFYNQEAVDPSFPMSGFNHVILCVPQPKDSIWLECTSKTTEFNVLSSFTENRNALLITENGGVLVSTPRSQPSENTLHTVTNVTLNADGSGKTMTIFRSTGEYKESMDAILEEKKDDQKEVIVYGWGFKQPDEFELRRKANEEKAVELLLAIEKVPEFTAGSKMFLSPRLYKLSSTKLPKAENRKHDYVFNFPYQKTDTTILHLPEFYVVEGLPAVKTLSCPYASYTTKYWYDEANRSIYSTASLTLNSMRIPAAGYAEVKKFYDDILQDNSQRIVVKKQ